LFIGYFAITNKILKIFISKSGQHVYLHIDPLTCMIWSLHYRQETSHNVHTFGIFPSLITLNSQVKLSWSNLTHLTCHMIWYKCRTTSSRGIKKIVHWRQQHTTHIIYIYNINIIITNIFDNFHKKIKNKTT
jgi:hypothetical protein